MSKYVVETFYTCSFKIIHKLNELNEKKLSELDNRKDGEVQILDVKFKHHDALEDAKVCGIIGRKIFKEFNIKKPTDIEKEFNLEVGSFIKDWK